MKPAAFDYRCASGLEDAARLLAEGDGAAKLLAGSQSLGPMLNLRLARPRQVIDISRLAELSRVTADAGHIEIGAGVTHAAIEDGEHAALRGHPMQQVAAGIAYRAVRTRGTLGGSLAHADPAADWVVALVALDAQLTLRSPRGSRVVPMAGFMQAAYTTVLAADEIVASVRVPQGQASHWGYHKFCRKPGEFADASAAVWRPAQGPARIVLGALDGAPRLLPELADALRGNDRAALSGARIAAAVAQALPERDAIDHQLHAVCLERALAQAGCPVQAAAGAAA